MSRDYARQSDRKSGGRGGAFKRRSSPSSLSSILLLASWVIVLSALLITRLIYIKRLNHTSGGAASLEKLSVSQESALAPVKIAKPVVNIVPSAEPEKSASKLDSVQFEFYNLLPKMAVGGPRHASPEIKSEEPMAPVIQANDAAGVAQTSAVSLKAPSSFALQLASLTSESDAADFQETLEEKGVKTHVLKIERGDQWWYRIQMGPYASREQASKIKNSLETNQKIHSIIVPNL
jgi:septal ring-binding cell division protein DamX